MESLFCRFGSTTGAASNFGFISVKKSKSDFGACFACCALISACLSTDALIEGEDGEVGIFGVFAFEGFDGAGEGEGEAEVAGTEIGAGVGIGVEVGESGGVTSSKSKLSSSVDWDSWEGGGFVVCGAEGSEGGFVVCGAGGSEITGEGLGLVNFKGFEPPDLPTTSCGGGSLGSMLIPSANFLVGPSLLLFAPSSS